MLLVTVKVMLASCYSRSAFKKEVGIICSSIPSFFGTKDKKSCEKLTVPPSLSSLFHGFSLLPRQALAPSFIAWALQPFASSSCSSHPYSPLPPGFATSS